MITFDNLGRYEYGRLGNQLFQIALIVAYAYKYNYKWAIREDWQYKSYFTYQFPTTNEMRDPFRIWRQNGTGYEDIPDMGYDVDFKGFFQSEKYFLHCRDMIKHIFTPTNECISQLKSKLLGVGCKLDTATCVIHVRRGDYLILNHFVGKQYYLDAISIMKNNGVLNFYIISDDLDWCRAEFIGNEYNFITNQADIEDLICASMFPNIIMANSSFSWWASYLGTHHQKKVICPIRPFTSTDNYSDYYPPEWTKIVGYA